MITKITCYETGDGKLFKKEEEAKEHELDYARTYIERALLGILKERAGTGLKAFHIKDITEYLFPNHEEAFKHVNYLYSLFLS